MAIYQCEWCGEDFKCKPYAYKKKSLKTCSKECYNELYWRNEYKRIEEMTGLPVNVYLFNRYFVDMKATRFIAKELGYGCSKTVANLMKRLGMDVRGRSESIKTQWIDNDERRKRTAKKLVESTGKGTEGREKLIRYMQTEEYKQKSSEAKQGEKNPMYGARGEQCPNWNPQRTKEQRIKERKQHKDKEWRISVFERDNYICQCCGYGEGHIIQAHHMNSWHWDESGRYDVDNGITLCEPCHKEFHSRYGYKNNTKQQTHSFINHYKRVSS